MKCQKDDCDFYEKSARREAAQLVLEGYEKLSAARGMIHARYNALRTESDSLCHDVYNFYEKLNG